MKTKKQKIKEYLESGNTITQREAIELFSAYRLAAVIHKLKKENMPIEKVEKTHINNEGRNIRYAEYKMIGAPGNKAQISMFSNDKKEFKAGLDSPPSLNEKKHIR